MARKTTIQEESDQKNYCSGEKPIRETTIQEESSHGNKVPRGNAVKEFPELYEKKNSLNEEKSDIGYKFCLHTSGKSFQIF